MYFATKKIRTQSNKEMNGFKDWEVFCDNFRRLNKILSNGLQSISYEVYVLFISAVSIFILSEVNAGSQARS